MTEAKVSALHTRWVLRSNTDDVRPPAASTFIESGGELRAQPYCRGGTKTPVPPNPGLARGVSQPRFAPAGPLEAPRGLTGFDVTGSSYHPTTHSIRSSASNLEPYNSWPSVMLYLRLKQKLKSNYPPDPGRNRPKIIDCLGKLTIRILSRTSWGGWDKKS